MSLLHLETQMWSDVLMLAETLYQTLGLYSNTHTHTHSRI